MMVMLSRFQCVNPSGAETGMFWKNSVNSFASDALAPSAVPFISRHGIDYGEYTAPCFPPGGIALQENDTKWKNKDLFLRVIQHMKGWKRDLSNRYAYSSSE